MKAIHRNVWFSIAAAFLALASPALAQEKDQPLPANTPPDGFTALFNGKDLTGWKGLVADPPARAKMTAEQLAEAQTKADERMNAHWRVADGTLVFDGKGDSLCTVKDYGDFEMLVDWKIKENGDSGIYLRGSPQVQIWDAKARDIGSGGLFNNKEHPSKPSVAADRPVGQWNTFRIKMVGDRVWVWLNDQLVTDGVVMENYWERDKPIYTTGQIELQNHGNTLYFRNIYIREIGEEEAAKTLAEIKAAESKPGAGFDVLFNGSDLRHWDFKAGGWVVEGDSMAMKPDAGYIWTKEKFDDFVLDLEFKMSEKCNSGVFFRSDPKDPVQGGFEIQVYDSHGKDKPGKHDAGALYDAVAPKVNAVKPAGEWNRLTITCQGPKITVVMNNQTIIEADLDQWTQPNKNPDGSENKFNKALKDLPRTGHIGFQDHGHPVWYRNVRVKRLSK